ASTMLTAPAQRVCFGSSLERRLFPLHYAPDRLGNQMSQQGPPHVGPGSYDNHEVCVREKESRGTFSSGFRYGRLPGAASWWGATSRASAKKIKKMLAVTPSPWQYQQDQSGSRVSPPGKIAFSSKAQRFKTTPCTSERSPGPGTYAHDRVTNRKVSWPMCFGRPDWSSLPQIGKKRFVYLNQFYND
uniref:Uncharacterized protein n=1 Tax=Pundamilia nyererei TaxID=303518 RepID=A0A3B4H0H4_9CICH